MSAARTSLPHFVATASAGGTHSRARPTRCQKRSRSGTCPWRSSWDREKGAHAGTTLEAMTAGRRGRDYVPARSAWLSAAKEALAADERVVAVLLEGSLGRGAGDEWSDLDLVVVLGDAIAAEFLNARLEWVTRFGEVLLVLDSPWNAPPTGAQINAPYEVGLAMPLYVDWSLWPAAIAATPSDVRVLVARPTCRIPEAGVTMDEFRRWPRQAVSNEVRGSRHARLPCFRLLGSASPEETAFGRVAC